MSGPAIGRPRRERQLISDRLREIHAERRCEPPPKRELVIPRGLDAKVGDLARRRFTANQIAAILKAPYRALAVSLKRQGLSR